MTFYNVYRIAKNQMFLIVVIAIRASKLTYKISENNKVNNSYQE